MHQHIKLLSEIIGNIDNDPMRSLAFYTGTLPDYCHQLHPPKDCKWVLMVDTLCHIEKHRDSAANEYEKNIEYTVRQILDKLNSKYQQHQNLCWESHKHHFHTTIEEYVNCPVTCLTEISEFLDRLVKEIYAQ
jgi:hypothetical protein